ncbi:hypothetical protein K431DRAFT_103116 [Polychaeton citri CBS 116435]|uniref:Uncharacterized protein n=1 Tax=Polychaeton citri CBS 116435 TaxID=1314669 RepID=A0A9P4Q5Q0_9PEZI|nr:hypothetical protein K431DRAFT_103116 [Polychaeton citri CBS 116435]
MEIAGQVALLLLPATVRGHPLACRLRSHWTPTHLSPSASQSHRHRSRISPLPPPLTPAHGLRAVDPRCWRQKQRRPATASPERWMTAGKSPSRTLDAGRGKADCRMQQREGRAEAEGSRPCHAGPLLRLTSCHPDAPSPRHGRHGGDWGRGCARSVLVLASVVRRWPLSVAVIVGGLMRRNTDCGEEGLVWDNKIVPPSSFGEGLAWHIEKPIGSLEHGYGSAALEHCRICAVAMVMTIAKLPCMPDTSLPLPCPACVDTVPDGPDGPSRIPVTIMSDTVPCRPPG